MWARAARGDLVNAEPRVQQRKPRTTTYLDYARAYKQAQ
jgi:hypothetical protein